jgi:hypothetical protein
LVRYFGRESVLSIPCEVEVISVGAFAWHCEIRLFEFESPSKLRCIESRAFETCRRLRSISLPGSTESLSSLCFRKCRNLCEIRFAAGSKLRRIEAESLTGCSSLSSIVIPTSVNENQGIDLTGVGDLKITWSE